MEKKENTGRVFWIVLLAMIFLFVGVARSQEDGKPLVLQEMTWSDVKEYLETNDMVIIPIGSTEQHGPHLPLGTDFYIATSIAKMISSRTGVVVSPVVLAGYSVYHSGFPGSLSLKPETLEQVLFETAEMLITYGFKRIMFLNAHGGNTIAQAKVVHRINHNTEAVAIALGDYAFRETEPPKDWFDQHAGVEETSIMLYLEPDLVHMDRAEKPEIHLSPQMEKYLEISQQNPELMGIFWSLLATPEQTGKGGASHQLSSNGIWSFSDPSEAKKEIGKQIVTKMVESASEFITTWKQIPIEKN